MSQLQSMRAVRPLSLIDIVVSIHNQEHLIEKILKAVCEKTTTPFNLILVFDGCTDKTKENALAYLDRAKPALLKALRITDTPDVHESTANNVGLKMATSDFVVMIQDDMEIKEKGWEKRITFPIRSLPDVFAVGSRGAFDIVSMSFEEQVYSNAAARELLNLDRNTFAVRDYINRGPIAFDRKRLAELGFLSQKFAPCNLDDADICLRAWKEKKWKAGVYWIDYYSSLKWSKTKQTPLEVRKEPASRAKNAKIISEDHADYLQSAVKHTENIAIPWHSVDYEVSTSRKSIAFHMALSHIFFYLRHAWSKIKYVFFRLKMNKLSPLSVYRKFGKMTRGESSEITRRRTEFFNGKN